MPWRRRSRPPTSRRRRSASGSTGPFGSGVARHFLRPYNEKLWAKHPLEDIVPTWTSERVVEPLDGADRHRRCAATSAVPRRAECLVGYPVPAGGFEAIFGGMASQVAAPVVAGEVATVDLDARQVVTTDGTVVALDELVSTIPLPAVVRATPQAPPICAPRSTASSTTASCS